MVGSDSEWNDQPFSSIKIWLTNCFWIWDWLWRRIIRIDGDDDLIFNPICLMDCFHYALLLPTYINPPHNRCWEADVDFRVLCLHSCCRRVILNAHYWHRNWICRDTSEFREFQDPNCAGCRPPGGPSLTPNPAVLSITFSLTRGICIRTSTVPPRTTKLSLCKRRYVGAYRKSGVEGVSKKPGKKKNNRIAHPAA